MTLSEYLQNPIGLDPRVSLYTVDGVGVSRLHRFLPDEIVDDFCNLPSSDLRTEQLHRIARKSVFAVASKTDADPPASREIPRSIRLLFHCNVGKLQSTRVRHLPMGRDFRSAAAFQKLFDAQQSRPLEKSGLVYANFSLNTHPSRAVVMEQLKALPFVDCELAATFLNYPISRERFARTLASYRFVVCPRGRGKDSFRFWDSLCCGCVPIVPEGTQPPWKLPFIEIQRGQWSKIDEVGLHSQWEQMLDQEYDFEVLTGQYWIDKIKAEYQSSTVAG